MSLAAQFSLDSCLKSPVLNLSCSAPQSTHHFHSQTEGTPQTSYDTPSHPALTVHRPLSWVPQGATQLTEALTVWPSQYQTNTSKVDGESQSSLLPLRRQENGLRGAESQRPDPT